MAFLQRGFQPYDGTRAPRGPIVLDQDSPHAQRLNHWVPLLTTRFESTGGGGLIREYFRKSAASTIQAGWGSHSSPDGLYGAYNPSTLDTGIWFPSWIGLTGTPFADPHFPTFVSFARQETGVNFGVPGLAFNSDSSGDHCNVRRWTSDIILGTWDGTVGDSLSFTSDKFAMFACAFTATGYDLYSFQSGALQTLTDTGRTYNVAGVASAGEKSSVADSSIYRPVIY